MIAAVELRDRPDGAVQLPAAAANRTRRRCARPEEPADVLRGGLRGRARRLDADEPGRLPGWPGTNWVAGHVAAGRPRGRRPSPRTSDAATATAAPVTSRASCAWRARRSSCRTAPILSPRLTFEHYVATELGFDGGNVKISVNGGAYAVVPSLGVHLQPLQRDPRDRRGREHEPARRPAGVQRHRRRRGRRQLGPVADRPDPRSASSPATPSGCASTSAWTAAPASTAGTSTT